MLTHEMNLSAIPQLRSPRGSPPPGPDPYRSTARLARQSHRRVLHSQRSYCQQSCLHDAPRSNRLSRPLGLRPGSVGESRAGDEGHEQAVQHRPSELCGDAPGSCADAAHGVCSVSEVRCPVGHVAHDGRYDGAARSGRYEPDWEEALGSRSAKGPLRECTSVKLP